MILVRVNKAMIDALMEKSRKGTHLVPEKRIVTRDGKTFQMTVWVDPRDKAAPAQGGFDFDEKPVAKKNTKTAAEMNKEVSDKRKKDASYEYRAKGDMVQVRKPGSSTWDNLAPTKDAVTAKKLSEKMNDDDASEAQIDAGGEAARAQDDFAEHMIGKGNLKSGKLKDISVLLDRQFGVDLLPEEVSDYLSKHGISDKGLSVDIAASISKKLRSDLVGLAGGGHTVPKVTTTEKANRTRSEILKEASLALDEVRNFHYHGDKFNTTYELARAIGNGEIDTASALHEVREAFSMMTNRKLHNGKFPDTYAIANAIDELKKPSNETLEQKKVKTSVEPEVTYEKYHHHGDDDAMNYKEMPKDTPKESVKKNESLLSKLGIGPVTEAENEEFEQFMVWEKENKYQARNSSSPYQARKDLKKIQELMEIHPVVLIPVMEKLYAQGVNSDALAPFVSIIKKTRETGSPFTVDKPMKFGIEKSIGLFVQGMIKGKK